MSPFAPRKVNPRQAAIKGNLPRRSAENRSFGLHALSSFADRTTTITACAIQRPAFVCGSLGQAYVGRVDTQSSTALDTHPATSFFALVADANACAQMTCIHPPLGLRDEFPIAPPGGLLARLITGFRGVCRVRSSAFRRPAITHRLPAPPESGPPTIRQIFNCQRTTEHPSAPPTKYK